MSIPTKNKLLLVGCGGSGIRSLKQFNKMMSGNRDWRENMSERIAYLVVDTEVAMTQEFMDSVAKDMDGVTPSFCQAFTPTEGYEKLSQITRRFATDPDGRERLSKYWWYTPDGKKPFVADGISPISDGAGQCPPISYLSVWNKIEDIKKKVSDLVDGLIGGSPNEKNPISKLQVYIVAGLAGGTGRGSWNTVAYTVKKVLKEKYQSDVDIAGIFFDSGCFSDISSGAKTGLGVNAITGFSEVSAWMKLSKGEAQEYSYTLPNFTNPKGSPVMEIKYAAGSVNSSDRCPINEAYVICEKPDSGAKRLDRFDEYFTMAGIALYALAIGIKPISGWKVNKFRGVQSMAAISFEVDSLGLRTFFQTRLRRMQLRKIIYGDDKIIDNDVALLLGGNDDKDSFFGRTKFDMSDVDSPMDSNLFAKMFEQMNGFSASAFVGERGAFATANKTAGRFGSVAKVVKDIEKKINACIDAPAGVNFAAMLAHVVDPNIIAADGNGLSTDFVNDFLMTVFAGADVHEKKYLGKLAGKISAGPSFARVKKFAAALKDKIEEAQGKLSQPCYLYIDGESIVVEDVDTIKARVREDIVKKSDREFNGIFGNPFNDDEINRLCATFESAVRCSAYLTARESLMSWFDSLLAAIANFTIRRQKSMLTILTAAYRRYDEIERENAKDSDNQNINTSRDVYLRYFSEEDVSSIIRALPEKLDTGNLYRRILKPIMSESTVNDLMVNKDKDVTSEADKCDAVTVDDERLSNDFAEILDKVPLVKDDDFEEEPLVDKVMDSINSITVRSEFLDNKFSIRGVLKNNIKHWNEALKNLARDEVQRNEFHDRFLAFTGVDIPSARVRDGRYRLPTADEMIQQIFESMANNCRPWWMLKEDSQPVIHAEFFAPYEFKPATDLMNRIKEDIGCVSGIGPVAFHGSDNDKGVAVCNDKVVIYVEAMIPRTEKEPFEKIASLDYCRDDEEIRERLELAEQPQAKSYFVLNADGKSYSESESCNGFLSPAFLCEPMSGLRWKPWKSEVPPSVREQDECEVCEALLYAFLGVSTNADEGALNELTGKDGLFFLKKPFIAMGAREQFAYTRETMRLDGNDFVVYDKSQLDIEDGTKLVVSIDNLFAYLVGDGIPGNGSDRDREQSKVDGREHRKNILRELEDFNIARRTLLNDAQYKQLRTFRDRWIKDMSRKATSDSDKDVWKRLLAYADKD